MKLSFRQARCMSYTCVACPNCDREEWFRCWYGGGTGGLVECRKCRIVIADDDIDEWRQRVFPMNLKWRKKPPREPGWYWCRDVGTGIIAPLHWPLPLRDGIPYTRPMQWWPIPIRIPEEIQ